MMLGQKFEQEISKDFHQRGIPILISPMLLRKKGLGQIDLAHLVNNKVIVYEIKSSRIGKQSLYRGKQITRLRRSTFWLARIFKKHAQLKIIAKR